MRANLKHTAEIFNNLSKCTMPIKCKTFTYVKTVPSARSLIQKGNNLGTERQITHDVTHYLFINAIKNN